jgi:hypothetical protein
MDGGVAEFRALYPSVPRTPGNLDANLWLACLSPSAARLPHFSQMNTIASSTGGAMRWRLFRDDIGIGQEKLT